MGQHRYNHNRKIVDKQPAKAKWIMPGSIVSFNYSGTDIFDRKPKIPPPPRGRAAAATTEELSTTIRPHPIMRRDSISRSGFPLTPIYT